VTGPTRRLALVVALSALLSPLLSVPASAITNGRDKTADLQDEQWDKGSFGTSRIDINNGERSCSGVFLSGDDFYVPKLASNDWVLTAASCFADDPAKDFNYSCDQDGYGRPTGYGDHVIFYTTANGTLRSMQQGSQAARAIGPSYYVIWRAQSAPTGASGWTGEVRVGPAGLKLDYHDGAAWNQTVWEVHRKTNAQDPFNDGDLRLWTDPYQTGIRESPTVATGGEKVGIGWQRYLDPAYRNQFTIDSEGRFYAIDASGALREFNWQPATKTWRNPAGDVIDTGWEKFDLITASGDGVLYARTPDGNLFRFQYDHSANTWVQRDKAAGSGWNAYTAITSPGGDILYGSGSSKSGLPVLRWHRYYSETGSWAPRDADGLGAVLNDLPPWINTYRVQATPNMCALRR
jgi:hypothetical protein